MSGQNCTYASYEDWIEMIIEDGRFTAAELGIAVISIYFRDASNNDLLKAGRVGKNTLVSAKRKMRELGYVEVSIGGSGPGNTTIVTPKFPDGRVFMSDRDKLISGTNEYHIEAENGISGTDTNPIIPLSTTREYHLVPLSTTKNGISGTDGYRLSENSELSGTDEYHKAQKSVSGPYIDNIITPPTPPPRDEGFSKSNFWGEVLNPTMHGEQSNIYFRDGRIILANGTRQIWLEKFGGDDERLELALIEAAGRTRPGSNRPMELQVEAILAAKVAQKQDQDARYDKAVKSNPKNKKTKPDAKDQIAKILGSTGD